MPQDHAAHTQLKGSRKSADYWRDVNAAVAALGPMTQEDISLYLSIKRQARQRRLREQGTAARSAGA